QRLQRVAAACRRSRDGPGARSMADAPAGRVAPRIRRGCAATPRMAERGVGRCALSEGDRAADRRREARTRPARGGAETPDAVAALSIGTTSRGEGRTGLPVLL